MLVPYRILPVGFSDTLHAQEFRVDRSSVGPSVSYDPMGLSSTCVAFCHVQVQGTVPSTEASIHAIHLDALSF